MKSFLSRDNLLLWLKRLIQEYTVIAPVQAWDTVLFQPVKRVEEIVLSYDVSTLSPKDVIFPPSETLFIFERKNGRWEARPLPEVKKQVLFGLHPCDAHGISLMDAAFLSQPGDPHYQRRRDATILVGLACARARPECFCESAGSGPQDVSHLDVLLIPTPQGYILQVRTARGAALFTGFNMEELEIDNPPPPATTPVPVAGITDVAKRIFNDGYWERLADRCIHCNLCAYVCPCCYCFDIRDYPLKGMVERVRSWESCQASGFARLAGGYDPRPSTGARLRQRFYHKFLYYPTQFKGQVKCTGCGRCVRACPVNIDIREIVSDMQKIEAKVARAT
ncbi:MAG: 4Fe-4S dicluster domain-containing protein [Chloroflexota bacterium]